jgi:hypothetical protein
MILNIRRHSPGIFIVNLIHRIDRSRHQGKKTKNKPHQIHLFQFPFKLLHIYIQEVNCDNPLFIPPAPPFET